MRDLASISCLPCLFPLGYLLLSLCLTLGRPHRVFFSGRKLDIEGAEFQLLGGLLASGALCGRASKVRHLFLEFHDGSIDWKHEGLPVAESHLKVVYQWMIKTHCPTLTLSGWH